MAANATNILVGADPEVFVYEHDTPRSAIGLIGGEKHAPRKVDRGALQEDNVLAEFNIDPAASEDEFVDNIHVVLNILAGTLPAGLRLGPASSHEFDIDYLREQGNKAMEFGCEPDYNAYTMGMNVMPDDAPPGLRTAGGHVHVGYTEGENIEIAAKVARFMDVYLGVASVLLDPDARRRKLYGGPGCFRTKVYGMEYRTLSNFWLHDERLTRWVYRNSIAAAQAALSTEEHCYDVIPTAGEPVPCSVVLRCIKENDKELAKKIISRCNIPLPEGHTV